MTTARRIRASQVLAVLAWMGFAFLAGACLEFDRAGVAELPGGDGVDARDADFGTGGGDVATGDTDDTAVEPDAPSGDTVEGGGDAADASDPACQLDCDADLQPLPPCSRYVLDEEACSCSIVFEEELAPCDDWNPCTVEERCKAGGGSVSCVGVPLDPAVLCDDGNPCTTESCELATGCSHQDAEAGSCDDGDPCTAGEVCADGACQAPTQFTCGTCEAGGPDTCEVDHGDGDPCNGTLVCVGGFCLVDAETVFPCPPSVDSCTSWGCEVIEGEPQCVALVAEDGTTCSDQSVCTTNDACLDGTCQGAASEQAACACSTDEDCAPLDDDNLCDGRVRCLGGLCKWDPTSVVDCTGLSGAACFVPKCDPAEGTCKASELPDGTACDDGDACSLGDACASGLCVGESPLPCGFLTNECATGTCVKEVGCVSQPNDSMESLPCDPGHPCVLAAQCVDGLCEVALEETCDDGDPCTIDSCEATFGCKHIGPPPPTCPAAGVCAGGVALVCQNGAYHCDLESVPDYHAVELCDGLDNDCDGAPETPGECAATVACGVGELAKDYGDMQACAVSEGLPWQGGMCGEGWNVCTYEQLLSRVGAASVPAGYWLAAAVEYDAVGGKFSASDTHDATCRAFDGDCGQSRSVQAVTWEGLYQDSLPYAAEAWGCTAGEPDADCTSAQALGVMCCEPLCTGQEDCADEDGDACTHEACVEPIGECVVSEAPAPPACSSEGVCAAGVPLACVDGALQCDPEALPGYEAQEVSCDGLDNDCDGLVDAFDPDLAAGVPPCALDVGVCAGATRSASHCQGGKWLPCSANDYEAVAPGGAFNEDSDAWCDGLDNDCNGLTDESFAFKGLHVGSACAGEGECAGGTVECSPDQLDIVCSSLPGGSDYIEQAELCDGLDNDCDGLTDEPAELDEVLSGCSTEGVCGEVPSRCEDGGWSCPFDEHDAYEPGAEVSCDGLDNDCDGETDEALPWAGAGTPQPKGSPCGPPECPGSVTCTADKAALTCSSQVEGGVEICDAIDNDCDGATDEGLTWDDPVSGPTALGEPCVGLGTCAGFDPDAPVQGVVQCAPDGTATCSTMPGGFESLSFPEVCDGLDNDCDGVVDDGLTWDGVALGEVCDGIGACGLGEVECGPAGQTICSSNPGGSASGVAEETCNALDDDCDGATDEAEDLDLAESGCSFLGVCTQQNVDAVCDAGAWSCDYTGVPLYQQGDEIGRCDGVDNDCDGATDEDYPTLEAACDGEDDDECPSGELVCAASGLTVECVGDAPVVEVCDGIDNDCDGAIDEEGAIGCQMHWHDGDEDGFGVGEGSCLCHSSGELTALQPGDCDDVLPAVNPEGAETCNGLDDDCDGATDTQDAGDLLANDARDCENQIGVCAGVPKPTELCVDGGWLPCAFEHYAQARPQTFEGDDEATCDGLDNDCDAETDEDLPPVQPCGNQSGVCGGALTPGAYCVGGVWQECDADVYEYWSGGAYELGDEGSCDGLDNDCDGTADDPFEYLGLPIGGGCDGVGACGAGEVECRADGTGATCSTNADGSTPGGAEETCNGVDDDCDGLVDENVPIEQSPCFLDGVCDATNVEATCVGGSWSCDYGGVEGYESGSEVSCDGLDNDCDGEADDDFLLIDVDGSLVGKNDACGSAACEGVVVCAPDGSGVACSSSLGEDIELCDSVDNDCDGQTDEGQAWVDPATGLGHGLGSPCDGVGECGAGDVVCGSGLTATCSTNPDGLDHENVPEHCDGLDNDCDGEADEGFSWQGSPLGASCDGTGACGVGVVVCSSIVGEGATCSTNPDGGAFEGSAEICDGLDNDCDGDTDEDLDWQAEGGCLVAGVCTPASTVATCLGEAGWQCEYQSSSYQSGNELGHCDGQDNDCDGDTDEDFDELGVACDSEMDADLCAYGVFACGTDGQSVVCTGDVASPERCESADVDDDCDGLTDEPGADDCVTFWRDGDDDGFGLLGDSLCRCEHVSDDLYDATNHDDCDDGATDVNPDASERCEPSGVDDDCDGETDEVDADGCAEYRKDQDEDGWGTDAKQCQCAPSWPYSAALDKGGDCNDFDPDVNPGEKETCDATDVDCDGTPIEEGAAGCLDYWRDDDEDGFGDEELGSRCLCEPDHSEGFTVTEGGDCCDIDNWVHPEQTSFFPFETYCFDDDWNCDGEEERLWPDFASCECIPKPGSDECSECQLNAGWFQSNKLDGSVGDIPDCGDAGWQPDGCYLNWQGNCQLFGVDYAQQACR